MEDLLFGLIAAIFEIIPDAFLEVLLQLAAGLLLRATRNLYATPPVFVRFLMPVGIAMLGVAAGFLSVLIFPRRLVHPARFHGISLFISPFLAGLAMSWVGHELRRRGKQPVAIESFVYGSLFALAVAIIRFTVVK